VPLLQLQITGKCRPPLDEKQLDQRNIFGIELAINQGCPGDLPMDIGRREKPRPAKYFWHENCCSANSEDSLNNRTKPDEKKFDQQNLFRMEFAA
jgi:hypothetical protein